MHRRAGRGVGDDDGVHRRPDLAAERLLGHAERLEHVDLPRCGGAAVRTHRRHDERLGAELAQGVDRAPQHLDPAGQPTRSTANGDGHARRDGVERNVRSAASWAAPSMSVIAGGEGTSSAYSCSSGISRSSANGSSTPTESCSHDITSRLCRAAMSASARLTIAHTPGVEHEVVRCPARAGRSHCTAVDAPSFVAVEVSISLRAQRAVLDPNDQADAVRLLRIHRTGHDPARAQPRALGWRRCRTSTLAHGVQINPCAAKSICPPPPPWTSLRRCSCAVVNVLALYQPGRVLSSCLDRHEAVALLTAQDLDLTLAVHVDPSGSSQIDRDAARRRPYGPGPGRQCRACS